MLGDQRSSGLHGSPALQREVESSFHIEPPAYDLDTSRCGRPNPCLNPVFSKRPSFIIWPRFTVAGLQDHER